MAEHKIALRWTRGDAPFTYEAYPRNHTIAFKDGAPTTFSASPAYRGDAGKGDPEDMLVAALSSCHMLSFLAIAAKKKVTVDSYEDDAVGFLENDGGKLWITRVILRPVVVCSADAATLNDIHHLAHEACFIANSVKTDVTVEPANQTNTDHPPLRARQRTGGGGARSNACGAKGGGGRQKVPSRL